MYTHIHIHLYTQIQSGCRMALGGKWCKVVQHESGVKNAIIPIRKKSYEMPQCIICLQEAANTGLNMLLLAHL